LSLVAPVHITIHEIGEAEAGRFIVMELAQGQTLRALDKPCAPALLVNLGGQIAKALIGTVAYMSPEQARGEAVGPASDIFALGIVFYELATERHPFKADSLVGMLHAINSQTPAAPAQLNPGLPPALESLILRMLEKEGRLRPTAAEVDQALGELSGRSGSGQLLRPPTKQTVERHTVIIRLQVIAARR
jgi:serine/threonine-protein kinase